MIENRKEYQGHAIAVVGGQFGDEAKGAVSAHLTRLHEAKYIFKAGVGPNAEHGIFVEEEGPYLKVNQLPLGFILSKDTQIRIGRNVVVDPAKLFYEMGKYRLHSRVKIDRMCPIISEENIRQEQLSKRMAQGIGSTLSGSGYARAEHVLRTAKVARDFDYLHPFLTDVAEEANISAEKETVVIEVSQGWGLNLSSVFYPNATSKDVTSSQGVADIGMNPFLLKDVVVCIKTKPTREGSGPLGFNNKEMSIEEIKKNGEVELSSIGGKIRRKADSIDFEMLAKATQENGATQIALTFCENYDTDIKNVKSIDGVTKKVWELIEKVQKTTNVPVTILNTGKRFDNFIYLPDKSVNLSRVHGEIDFSLVIP